MNDCALRGPVYAFNAVGSTMEAAAALAHAGSPEGTLVFAAQQSKGRGRQGRAWASPAGGAYFSIIVRPRRSASEAPQLSLVTGLAVAEGVRQLTRVYPSIRWPNDVLVQGKKLAGILLETRDGAVIVGVGVNVAATPPDVADLATSVADIFSPAVGPHQVTGAVWRRFSLWYDRWTRDGFAPVREALRAALGYFGQPVHITAGTEQFEGTVQDVDEHGRLVVRLDAGTHRAFDMGEVVLLR
jgi:BirA family biotin operon repressor/biotin-[acetyl-CoA-carboxylase] ligase